MKGVRRARAPRNVADRAGDATPAAATDEELDEALARARRTLRSRPSRNPYVSRESSPSTSTVATTTASRRAAPSLDALRRASLKKNEDVPPFLARIDRSEGAHAPTLGEMQKASAICAWIGIALARGDALAWTQISKAHETIFGEATIRRVVVLDAIEHAIAAVERVRETRAWSRNEHLPDDGYDGASAVADAAAEALESLVAADHVYAKLSVDAVRNEIDGANRGERAREGHWKGGAGNKHAVGIAASLAVLCGAFGDTNVAASRRAFLGARTRAHM